MAIISEGTKIPKNATDLPVFILIYIFLPAITILNFCQSITPSYLSRAYLIHFKICIIEWNETEWVAVHTHTHSPTKSPYAQPEGKWSGIISEDKKMKYLDESQRVRQAGRSLNINIGTAECV